MLQSSTITSARNKRRASSGSTASTDSAAPDPQGTTAEPWQGWYIGEQAQFSQPQQVDSDWPETRRLAKRKSAGYRKRGEPPVVETTGSGLGTASTSESGLLWPGQVFSAFLDVPGYGDIKLTYDYERCALIVEDKCKKPLQTSSLPSRNTSFGGIETLVLMVQKNVSMITDVVECLIGVGFQFGDITKIEIPPKTYNAPESPSHPIEVMDWGMKTRPLLDEIFEAVQGKMPKLVRGKVVLE